MSAIYPTKPIADIKLGQRHRKDLGDIEALAASIKEVGLLHPVVINPPPEGLPAVRDRRHPKGVGTGGEGGGEGTDE